MKKIIILIVGCLALIQTISAQGASYKLTDAEANEMLGMIKDLRLCQTSWAYRSVALEHMLKEANYYSERLQLPTSNPIQISNLQAILVSEPWYSMIKETNAPYLPATVFKTHIFDVSIPRGQRASALQITACGSIWTANFCFFFRVGRLWSVVNRVQDMERFDLYPVWARTPSLIDSNGAYQIATQWLASVDVDVATLGGKYTPKVEQQWFWNRPGLDVHHPPGDTNKTMLPIFNVTWGADAAQVRILGATKELMELRVGDSTLSSRPLLIITNAIELNNIPDPQIKHLERPLPSQVTNTPSAISPTGERETKP